MRTEVQFMCRSLKHVVVLCSGLLAAGVFTCARADVWNKKTVVTFPEPVEVPGAVLEPGRYVMKLVDSQSDRHIVQFLNADENQVYSTALAIPNSRFDPADKSILTFYEAPGGKPQALRAWFYPVTPSARSSRTRRPEPPRLRARRRSRCPLCRRSQRRDRSRARRRSRRR